MGEQNAEAVEVQESAGKESCTTTPTTMEDGESNSTSKGKKIGALSSLGRFHSFLLIASLILIPLIGVMAWDVAQSRDDPAKKKNTAACELLHGKLVEKTFPTEKKGSSTESFTICEENGSGKILMATGKSYKGKDNWVDTCQGTVFSRDESESGGTKRSLICLSDGKVSKATVVELN